MINSRIKLSSVVQNQFPDFVKENYPLLLDFIKQYYIALDSKGSTLDILQNIDNYVKVDILTEAVDSTTLLSEVSYFDDAINVVSTNGFPNTYGLIQIDDEVILYLEKTDTSFLGCIRGFSGVTSFNKSNSPDTLEFKNTESADHSISSKVTNLSTLFLKEFLEKVKKQITPGFEGRDFYEDLNDRLFIKQSRNFYESKGTDESFKILFRALYGEEIQVIRPSEFLLKPSDAGYRVTNDLVVERLSGDPGKLLNRTIYQDQDSQGLFQKSFGSVNAVERIVRSGKEYFILSLDFDFDKDINVKGSIGGNFSIHPSTYLIGNTLSGDSILTVDSTIGFPESGTLKVKTDEFTEISITYTSKNYNQFLGCSGITEDLNDGQFIRYDIFAYGYTGIGTSNITTFRVTGVLSDLSLSETKGYDNNQKVQIKTLGILPEDNRSNNWLFNAAPEYRVSKISLESQLNKLYRVETFDDTIFGLGDDLLIKNKDGSTVAGQVSEVNGKNLFVIKTNTLLNLSLVLLVSRLISKTKSSLPQVSGAIANVQNVYVNSEKDLKEIYVASNSLPSYGQKPLDVKDGTKEFNLALGVSTNILDIPNHGFYTGDAVAYIPSNENEKITSLIGTFYVKKISPNQISLSKGKVNLTTNPPTYIDFIGFGSTDLIKPYRFSDKVLYPQKLLRKISDPVQISTENVTTPGSIGILVNGVEISNYKSRDSVYYGEIEDVKVISEGVDYDVINPPSLNITDNIGTGASAYCVVEGSLKKVNIEDSGFGYLEKPIVTITGGNGSGALVDVNTVTVSNFATFNAESSTNVNISSNIIGFSTSHRFFDGERVLYETLGQTAVSGLTTSSYYYISVVDDLNIKLHTSEENAVSGTNPINLTALGQGFHNIRSTVPRFSIGSVNIVNEGFGYSNRRITVTSSGINTVSNYIYKKNHGFNSGEFVRYSSTTSNIGGLNNITSYYVTKIDDDTFALSLPSSTSRKNFEYQTKQYVNLTSSPVGEHIFKYPDIQLRVSGKISNRSFSAKLNPIIRGNIKTVFVEEGGVSYGSSEVLNFNRQPSFTLSSGQDAEIRALIVNGSISQVIVENSGSGYNYIPDIEISTKSGNGAVLTPIIVNGSLSEVKIINPGSGYLSADTSLNVISPANGAAFEAQIKSWNINTIARREETDSISDDDGIITLSLDQRTLSYSHAYAPRLLRQSVFASKFVNGVKKFFPDLQLDSSGREVDSTVHSPIIGWAYDGNPIYGPYGYDTPEGGPVRTMISGYERILDSNRPPFSPGFFVNDFKYTGSGDLDQYNGRFCITPDYPNGVYAYFSTVSLNVSDEGRFNNYKKPTFPYFIGNEFKSKKIDFNFDRSSNQDDIDVAKNGLYRNTQPYNFTKDNTSYNYIVNSNKISKQLSTINSCLKSGVESLKIVSGGEDYQVGDIVTFDTETTGGSNAVSSVEEVLGKSVVSVATSSVFVEEVEFFSKSPGVYVGVTSVPYDIKTDNIVYLQNISEPILNSEENYKVKVESKTLTLKKNISDSTVTGLVTYFSISGPLTIVPDDIFQIEDEKVKVLNVDRKSYRIRVLREYDGTVGSAHTQSTKIIEVPRRFTLNSGISTDYNYEISRKIYFDPSESIGTAGGTTITFSNPGIGITQIFVPENTIYFPNHGFATGDRVEYSNEGGQSIEVSGLPTPLIPTGQVLFVGRVDDNFFKISANNIGFGTEGAFIGIGTTSTVLDLIDPGTGSYHSFKTINENKLTSSLIRNLSTVSTASTHGLLNDDLIRLNILSGITTNVSVFYPKRTEFLGSPFLNTNEYYGNVSISQVKTFSRLDVDAERNIITIPNHGFKTGDKLFFTKPFGSLDPSFPGPYTPLTYGSEYYCIVISNDKIKLAETEYKASLDKPIEINLVSSSGSDNAIGKINPQITAYANQKLRFDLSHYSLSYFNGISTTSAFNFDFYLDETFRNKFYSSGASTSSEITRNGIVGVTSDAYVELSITKDLPETLYYKLTPVGDETLPLEFLDYDIDTTVKDYNKISIISSKYNKSYNISGVTSTTFDIVVDRGIEQIEYTNASSSIKYTTPSLGAYGSIAKTKTIGGFGYKYLPSVTNIQTNIGKNAILEAESRNIGKIQNITIDDIGFDYPCDTTLAPTAKLPQVMKINPLTTLDFIRVLSFGKNYSQSPDILLLDSLTNTVVEDVILEYTLGDSFVNIIRNTNGFNEIEPKVVAINNSNGIGISSIFYDNSSKDVVLYLSVGFSTSTDFPFSIGDKVLIENVSVGVNSTGKGYNSENYEYSLFELTDIDPNIGGNGTITYNLSGFLNGNEFPGSIDIDESLPLVVPEKYLPVFEVSLKTNKFLVGENVSSDKVSGTVLRYDEFNKLVTVSSDRDFIIGKKLFGQSSNTLGNIVSILDPFAQYKVSSSSVVNKGWIKETGYLNNSLQRLPDNDYYQNFSYSLNSSIEYEKWNNVVGSLNHIAGFKRFSDLNVICKGATFAGIDTVRSLEVSQLQSIFDLVSNIDTQCISDFDFATERTISVDGKLISKEIDFNNTKVSNYVECRSNRVLKIDDISDTFNATQNGFELNFNGLNIFKRDFDGSDSNIVDLANNFITIPNHFFVTGEEIEYISSTPLSIAPTNIPGIGVTDILPSSLYVIKDNDIGIKVAASASDALAIVPVNLELTSLGLSTSHTFIAKNKNQKTIIGLDGVIQSPVSITNITTTLSSNVGIADTIISLSGITSFFNGDLIKIDDEILKIRILSFNGTFTDAAVQRGWMGTTESSHTSGSVVVRVSGNYNIVDNSIYFYDSPYGELYGSEYTGLSLNSKFTGRVFLRSGIVGTSTETYAKNYLFDDISSQFDATTSQFTLTQLNSNVNIGSEEGDNPIILVRNVLQSPPSPGGTGSDGDYNLNNNIGVTTISFTGTGALTSNGDYDANRFGLPLGGVIVSVSSTEGFGYQSLVSAGGTAIISTGGTVQSVSIGNSGSGYRDNQIVNVGVGTTSSDIFGIGTAIISNGNIIGINITDGGSGYSQTYPPIVIIDAPLPYSDIPLIYSSASPSGVGTGAKVDVIVGSGSSVLEFKLSNTGYGYNEGDILTIPTLGDFSVGQDPSLSFSEFQLTVDKTFNDNFSGWYLGGISLFDNFDEKFNGIRTKFPLKIQQENYSIETIPGSNINIAYTLLVLINDVLQEPDVAYTFTGGSNIQFTEPPVRGDSCKILFYNGTTGVDTENIEIVKTIKIGDTVRLNDTVSEVYQQNDRVVFDILSSRTIETDPYLGPGVNPNTKYERSFTWCKQREDLVINGKLIGKARESYEPIINPTANIIQPVSIASTEIFVDNLYTFFNPKNEAAPLNYNNYIKIVSRDVKESCTAEALVSSSGVVTSISILDGGFGYSAPPSVTISNPSSGGTLAVASASIDLSGSVTTINLIGSNSGYDESNPPSVLVEPPSIIQEFIPKVSYEGDFGIITGIGTTNVGVSTGLVFDFYIPDDSYLRDLSIAEVGLVQSVSGIDTGYYFVVRNSNIGNGVISLDSSGSQLGVTTEFLDNVYQVISVSDPSSGISTDVFGETTPRFVRKVTVSVNSYNGISGFGYGKFFGEFSWGKISTVTDSVNRRTNPQEFNWYNTGISGITSSASLSRVNPLKYFDYDV